MTWPKKTQTFREHLQIAILDICEFWDIWSEWSKTEDKHKAMANTCEIGVISDSWDLEFMTITVTKQLGVMLNRIRNSRNFFKIQINFEKVVVRWDCQKKKRYFLGIFPKWRTPPPPPPFGNFEKILPFFLVKLKIFGWFLGDFKVS